MDQHDLQRGRSPSAGHQQQPQNIRQSLSPSPARYPDNDQPVGLGLGLDQSSAAAAAAAAAQAFPSSNIASSSNPDFTAFNDTSNLFNDQSSGQSFNQSNININDPNSFTPNQQQSGFLDPSYGSGGDFPLFPADNLGGTPDHFDTTSFPDNTNLGSADMSAMTMSQAHHNPTPPHLLNPEGHQPGSAHQSPSFNQHQFSSPGAAVGGGNGAGGHSRHASLGPEAALLPNQMNEWSQPQFQGHRRSPSAHSDVSSVAHSPNPVSSDTFESVDHHHSPMQHPQDPALFSQIQFDSFTISDPAHSSPNLASRSPSHSPAISPRLMPQTMVDMGQPAQGSMMAGPTTGYATMQQPEAFPSFQQPATGEMPQMAPSINIEFAPVAQRNAYDAPKPPMDQDSLTPPERGRQRSRPRAVTDPYNSGGSGVIMGRPLGSTDSLSPHLSPDPSASPGSSRSLSPLDRSSASPSRRRQSTSAVPNNVMALRLADPEYSNSQESGNSKRVQKHPATFQCTLCPKRFTRAYNLRSHLRTHTDERPFVCTVCGKAFARQHDRKRHEGLHSGEKKFVCKGELKNGGSWGCGRRFARADALGRHFRSEAGRICIKPLLEEEMLERQRVWEQQQQQRMQSDMSAMVPPPMTLDSQGFPMDQSGGQWLPQALLNQYPALAGLQWSGQDANSGMEDDLSGRSSFDASDYDGDESGYVSTGTGFGASSGQNFAEQGYGSDYGPQ